MSKKIQEQFGDQIIQTVTEFARSDLDDVATLQAYYLDHVSNQDLQRTLAETLYGARWIYKLGLALLVKDEEQMAHVRAQLIDYASVCEGILSDMVLHGIDSGIFTGAKYQLKNFRNTRNTINWGAIANKEREISKRNFYWLIEVAKEENLISAPLANRLHNLRKDRNSVHLRERTYKSFLGKSHAAFKTLQDAVAETKAWKAANP